jgi:competence protein ComEC
MDEEIRDAFTQSGMLHVLAISGMHVAILAVLLVAVARAFGLSHRMTSLWVIVATVAYTLLTDCRPPVMRATTLVCLFCLAKLFYRRPAYFNAMAIAVVALLLWNPSDLFDVGAQLSFLAVLGVLWGARLMRPIAAAPTVYDLLGNATQAGWMRESGGRVWGVVKEGYLISLAVFFFSAPLIAARFHLVSPIGVVINVVLAPLSTLVLWCGYVHLAVGLLLPWISAAPAWFFDLGLRALLVLVEASARIRMSHAYVPGPPDWWLAGYYGILFAAAFVPPLCRAGCRKWSILTGWAVAGLACGLYWPAPNGLRCTFLSVGHGGAILIETPSGRTLLYDAGALNDSRIAQRAVQEVLWNHGYGKIDSILASHADIDHFNAIAGLIQTLPVGSLLVSQQFLDFRQPAVVSVCDAAAERDVPIQLIHDGDRLSLDARVAITVLHPPPGRPHADDNANSAVVLIEFAGRRILLTGDLDGSGQAALLSQPPHDVDVLLAPHHGSAKANPPALAQWAHPEHVVVSAGPRLDLQRLAAVYGPDAEVLSTYRAGAITFEITPEGNLHRSTIRPVAPTHHRMGSTTFAIQ